MSAISYLNAADETSPLDIAPVGGRIGAEVRNIRLSASLSDAEIAAVRAALTRHKVLFFRDQDHLDDSEQEGFAGRLGKIVPHPTVPALSGTKSVLEIHSRHGRSASSWHTDVTFSEAYPEASILRAITVPEAGGDTLWANTAAAYDDLPESLRKLADTLWAVHSNDYDYASVASDSTEEERESFRAVFTSTVYETEHPLVRVHPISGERTLVLGHFIKKIVGLGTTDSQRLFSILQDHVTQPENTVRWRWRAGDVAIWDNRATQHRAIGDFGPQTRILHRVTLDGDVPVSIDGQRSHTIKPVRLELAAAE